MTPYTLRERRENIARHGSEAYPGQHEATLAALVRSDAERATIEADSAVMARIGGNVYRGIDMMPHSRRWDDDTYHASAKAAVQNVQNNRKASRRAQLPEAAFDWPIYRIAMLDAGLPGNYALPSGTLAVLPPANIVGDGLHAAWLWRKR
jgi:hypothetical protein